MGRYKIAGSTQLLNRARSVGQSSTLSYSIECTQLLNRVHSVTQSGALSYSIGCTQLLNRVHSVAQSGALSCSIGCTQLLNRVHSVTQSGAADADQYPAAGLRETSESDQSQVTRTAINKAMAAGPLPATTAWNRPRRRHGDGRYGLPGEKNRMKANKFTLSCGFLHYIVYLCARFLTKRKLWTHL